MRFLDTSKNICCDDVIRCIFDFNKLDINVYKKLKEDGELKAQELAYKLKKERSTVYRSLQKLTKCGLCIKKTNKIDAGG
ncbi:MAG: ArsR family transcriptional regulator, partial [Candidatus Thermoplasmatota archaeon]|nr:ArsR family transcriptional regulator [Candidatus Thermoplasmatota archaeon]